MEFRNFVESAGVEGVVKKIEAMFPFARVSAYENDNKIELMQIKLPPEMRGRGFGTKIIGMLKDYASSVGKPIVLVPEAERGHKKDLERFYGRLGFVRNRGRSMDYTLSSPVARTMYWRPS